MDNGARIWWNEERRERWPLFGPHDCILYQNGVVKFNPLGDLFEAKAKMEQNGGGFKDDMG
jgi:hypothetical protein